MINYFKTRSNYNRRKLESSILFMLYCSKGLSLKVYENNYCTFMLIISKTSAKYHLHLKKTDFFCIIFILYSNFYWATSTDKYLINTFDIENMDWFIAWKIIFNEASDCRYIIIWALLLRQVTITSMQCIQRMHFQNSFVVSYCKINLICQLW